MIDEQKLRELGNQFICHPASRHITEIEEGGEAIKALLDELATLHQERTAWRVTAENAEKDAARYRWLRRTTNFVTSKGRRIDVRNSPDLWDSSIDAAITSTQEQT